MRVNSLLAAKNFNVRQENILIGNGAAELIKAVMGSFAGNVGFVRPTFEEYPNRYDKAKSICFIPGNGNYSYNEEDIISYFGDKDISSLVIVNPDNPTGNYIPKSGVMRLIDWSADKGIKLVIDESFIDFADEADSTIIEQSVLEANPQLYVVKSISKSYGVPGLRLGVLASGDKDMIDNLKKDVAIWNINSFGEFYMQIAEKYERDYKEGLVKFRAERARYAAELSKIPMLRVIPSQANYIMAELSDGITSKELTKRLLLKHNLLIRDLSTKIFGKQYIRLAVRDTKDNDRLLQALKEELHQEGRK